MATYITQAEGDTYFATRMNSTEFTGATSDEKDAALDTAERDLLALYDYPTLAGDVTAAQQNAICEQALMRLQNPEGFDARVALQAMGVQKAGTVGEDYGGGMGIPIHPYAKQVLQDVKKTDTDAAAAFVLEMCRDEDA